MFTQPIDHPAVNWTEAIKRNGSILVVVTCPKCSKERYVSAKSIRHQHRAGRFTARCLECAVNGLRASR